MATNIPPAERLLDLVIALCAGPALSKQDIRARVAGYDRASSDASFARMFERDKDLLRELGVPLEAVVDPHFGDDVRYRIDTVAYPMAEIELDREELAVVSLASQVWRDAVWHSRADRAVTKLRAVGSQAGEQAGAAPIHLAQAGESLDVLVRAIAAHTVVEFDYLAASTAQLSHRQVEPWRVIGSGKAWYLIGFDRGRADTRSFRLGRMVGRVTPRDDLPPFDPVSPGALEAALSSHGPGVRRVARLALVPGSAHQLRRQGKATGQRLQGRDIVEVAFTSAQEFAAQVASAGAAAVVLEPDDLRARVVALLQAVAHD